MTTTSNPELLATSARTLDPQQTVAQLGRNIWAISGGRVRLARLLGAVVALELPVSSGYVVRITLAANDTYTVQRVMRRAGKVWVKGTQTDVYAEDLGEVAYTAGMYKNLAFG